MLHYPEFYDSTINSHKVECCFHATLVVADKIEGWKDLDHSITMQLFFNLKEIQERADIQPSYLKDGKWLNPPKENLYRGYEAG